MKSVSMLLSRSAVLTVFEGTACCWTMVTSTPARNILSSIIRFQTRSRFLIFRSISDHDLSARPAEERFLRKNDVVLSREQLSGNPVVHARLPEQVVSVPERADLHRGATVRTIHCDTLLFSVFCQTIDRVRCCCFDPIETESFIVLSCLFLTNTDLLICLQYTKSEKKSRITNCTFAKMIHIRYTISRTQRQKNSRHPQGWAASRRIILTMGGGFCRPSDFKAGSSRISKKVGGSIKV